MTVWLVALFVAAAPAGAPAAACRALAAEVVARMGAAVTVTGCVTDAPDGPWASARADASARIGVPSWFTLVGPSRTARVQATLDADALHARAAHPIGRGRPLSPDLLRVARGPLTGARLAPLPASSTLTGARTMRPIDAGAVIQGADVTVPPVVRAGEPVVAVVRIGAVEVTAAMTAVDAGAIGDDIRIAHKDRRRVLRARVVAPGRVEVRHER